MTDTCPTAFGNEGSNTYKARAIIEHLNAKKETGTSTVSVAAKLTNGTTWTQDFSMTSHKEKLETETNAFAALNSLDCLTGWHNLPSGKMVCIVASSKDYTSRKTWCRDAGAYLMELTSLQDAQSFLYMMYTVALTSTESVALGAEVGPNNTWVWEHSGEEVEVCTHGCILKTSSNLVDIAAYSGRALYLDFVNVPTSSSTPYMSVLPYFDLHTRTGGVSDSTYFGCMKDGEGSSATAPTITVSQEDGGDQFYIHDILEIVYTLRTPHRTQFPFNLELTPQTGLSICLLKITHIGNNFPCILKPTGDQQRHSSNSSDIWYEFHKRPWGGKKAGVSFDMVSNWGRFHHPAS